MVPKNTSTFSFCISGPRTAMNRASPCAVQQQLGKGWAELNSFWVLGHDDPDADALLRVILDEARKVGGVSAQIAIT
jgi:hypothetical protein